MDVVNLAKAVVYWAEYEDLCNRGKLLSESSLKHPIGEFLIANHDHELSVEEPYPISGAPKKGRPKAVDFCLKRVGGEHPWTAILESKWINDRRTFSQEIFDDLIRLETVRRDTQAEAFDRFLLVAGRKTDVTAELFNREVNVGGGRIKLFETILPTAVGALSKVRLVDGAAKLKDFWNGAATACGEAELPLSLNVKLLGSKNSATYCCYVWRVTSSSKRSTRPVPI